MRKPTEALGAPLYAVFDAAGFNMNALKPQHTKSYSWDSFTADDIALTVSVEVQALDAAVAELLDARDHVAELEKEIATGKSKSRWDSV